MKICKMCGGPNNRRNGSKFCSKICTDKYYHSLELKKKAKNRQKNYNYIMNARISQVEEKWPFDKLPSDVTMTQMCPMG